MSIIKSQFSVSLKSDFEARKILNELSEKYKCQSHRDIFDVLIRHYQNSSPEAQEAEASYNKEVAKLQEELQVLRHKLQEKQAQIMTGGTAGAAPKPAVAQDDFFAKVPARAKEFVAQFRQDMFDDFQHTSDWEILKHVVQTHLAEKQGKTMTIPVPPRLRQALEKHAQEPIDSGEVSGIPHFTSKTLVQHFKRLEQKEKEPQKKKGGWFE